MTRTGKTILTIIIKRKKLKQDITPINTKLWWVEIKFHSDWTFYAAYADGGVAKAAAQQVFDSFPYDREGDGVRIRRACIVANMINVPEKVHWVRWCKYRGLHGKV